jgi:ABC-2 type transport system permease protein
MASLRHAAGPMTDALHAEWTKLRTVASSGWLMVLVVGLTIGASTIVDVVVKCPMSCDADTTRLSLSGVQLSQAAVAIFAVVFVSGEYSSGMILSTLTAMPRRWSMLAAKAAVVAGVVLVAATVGVLGSLLAGRLIMPGNGFSVAHGFLPLSLYHGATMRAAVGSVLYLTLIALLSLGLATAFRESAVAITVVLGLLYVVPLIGDLVLNAHWAHRIGRYSPGDAGLAVQITKNLDKAPIGPWAGIGVLACWALAALLTGGLLLRCRDA